VAFLARFLDQLHWLDWIVLVAYFVFSLGVGLYFVRRAGSSTQEFFVSGRNLPWWLAGTSMVATSFSVDTPLFITGLVRARGIQGNWLWWCFAMGGMLAAFVFAQLWRRSEVVTDVELAQLRYAGRPAAVLRGFRAWYMTLYANCLTMGWVFLAMIKVFDVVFDVGPIEATVFSAAITLVYATLGGLWGVVVTDLIQFVLAMAGAVVLAWFAVDAVGGIGGLLEGLESTGQGALLSFSPSLERSGQEASGWVVFAEWWSTALATFLVLVTVQWWANKNADGGSIVIQRMAASKDEREAVLGTLWFQVANYALRPWPWILVALATVLLYPGVADPESAYPQAMVDYLPAGLLGLTLASMVAAFMSTLTSYINLSAAYLVNDFYRPFVVRDRSERHYVLVGRLATVGALAVGGVIAWFGYHWGSIVQLFQILLALGAGIGLVYLARWFWWRVNAWSEIAAMVASTVIGGALGLSPQLGGPSFPFAAVVMLNLVGSTIVWVTVTYATPPTPMEKLVEFHRRSRPPGWWGPVREAAGEVPRRDRRRLKRGLGLWSLGVVFVYAALFGSGKLLLLEWSWGLAWSAVAIVTGWALVRQLTRERIEALLGGR